jgi:hypothetical protein
MNWTTLLFTCLLATGGFIASTYEVFARANMLPVGQIFHSRGAMSIIGGFVVFGAAILSAFINPWWSILLVLVGAWLFTQIIIQLFKGASQLLSPILMIVGGILLAVYL